MANPSTYGATDIITLTRGGGIYTSSRKEPDVHIIVDGLYLPTVCAEVGYSESNEGELWKLDINRNPCKEQSAAIFPEPAAPQPPIFVAREQLFGQAMLSGRPPLGTFPLSLDDFRITARFAMLKQGLTLSEL